MAILTTHQIVFYCTSSLILSNAEKLRLVAQPLCIIPDSENRIVRLLY